MPQSTDQMFLISQAFQNKFKNKDELPSTLLNQVVICSTNLGFQYYADLGWDSFLCFSDDSLDFGKMCTTQVTVTGTQ